MAALVATSMGVVREVLGDSVVDEVDGPIVDYIANVLADQDFDFGPPDGHTIFHALGELLIDVPRGTPPRLESHRHSASPNLG